MHFIKPMIFAATSFALAGCNLNGTAMSSNSPTSMSSNSPASTTVQPTQTATVDPNLPNSFTPTEAAKSTIARSFITSLSRYTVENFAGRPSGRVPVELSAQMNADGATEWVMTIDGDTVTLGPNFVLNSNSRVYTTNIGTPANTRTVRLVSPGDSWAEVISGTGAYTNVVPIAVRRSYPGGASFSYGTFGKTTLPENLPDTGSATFRGQVYGNERLNQGGQTTSYNGDVELIVDFANARLSGEMDNFRNSNGGQAIPGTLVISPTDIVNGAFASDLTLTNVGGATNFARSAINGRFYGDRGEEAGGDFSYVTPVAGNSFSIGVGAFVAKQ